MTYNPRIQNLDNNIIDISGNLAVTIIDGTISGSTVNVSSLTASTLSLNTFSSSAPANIRLGTIKRKTRKITGSATLGIEDDVVFIDASSQSINIILPFASITFGKKYTIKKIDSTTSSVIVQTNPEIVLQDTIDGQSSSSLATQNEAINLISDGTSSWYIT